MAQFVGPSPAEQGSNLLAGFTQSFQQLGNALQQRRALHLQGFQTNLELLDKYRQSTGQGWRQLAQESPELFKQYLGNYVDDPAVLDNIVGGMASGTDTDANASKQAADMLARGDLKLLYDAVERGAQGPPKAKTPAPPPAPTTAPAPAPTPPSTADTGPKDQLVTAGVVSSPMVIRTDAQGNKEVFDSRLQPYETADKRALSTHDRMELEKLDYQLEKEGKFPKEVVPMEKAAARARWAELEKKAKTDPTLAAQLDKADALYRKNSNRDDPNWMHTFVGRMYAFDGLSVLENAKQQFEAKAEQNRNTLPLDYSKSPNGTPLDMGAGTTPNRSGATAPSAQQDGPAFRAWLSKQPGITGVAATGNPEKDAKLIENNKNTYDRWVASGRPAAGAPAPAPSTAATGTTLASPSQASSSSPAAASPAPKPSPEAKQGADLIDDIATSSFSANEDDSRLGRMAAPKLKNLTIVLGNKAIKNPQYARDMASSFENTKNALLELNPDAKVMDHPLMKRVIDVEGTINEEAAIAATKKVMAEAAALPIEAQARFASALVDGMKQDLEAGKLQNEQTKTLIDLATKLITAYTSGTDFQKLTPEQKADYLDRLYRANPLYRGSMDSVSQQLGRINGVPEKLMATYRSHLWGLIKEQTGVQIDPSVTGGLSAESAGGLSATGQAIQQKFGQ